METHQAEPVSRWRTRLEGYLLTVALAALGAIITAARAGDNVLSLAVGVFPIAVGWLCSAIVLELGIARDHGRGAIRSSIAIGMLVTLVNLVLFLTLLYYLGLT